ncbi:TBC1 domain family member 13-like [Gossypium australe]|uniref:TBC1 domain family member 13-like n=1 Tax=Gossypium australe TaxID=47621 RepID=A0A5B6WRP2_9ROSI|nr:TBC1 domain family member 13-like [Gossypium australe]
MAKERIPDWLNSSLWSTTPSVDDRLHRFSLSPTTTTTTTPAAAAVSEPIVQPTVPVSAPAAASRPQSTVTSQKYEFRDPIDKNSNNNSNDNDQNASPSGVSLDDISRQAQLLAELLLGYLPPDRLQWSSELAKKRSEYKQFKEELLMNPASNLGFLNVFVASQTEITRKLEKSEVDDHSKSESSGLLSRSQVTHGEHPLSLGESSIWNQFFQDTEIIEQIDRDVKRTHPDMHFFSGDSPLAKSNQDALKDILIVFAKLNPGIRYVQGMNEILAPLFYVFRNDPDEEMAAAAEADSFFCFVELLSGFRDHFCKQLDNSTVGIRSTISRLSQFLKEHDEELWRHLEITTNVNPQFYAFRWITLLLTQEFNFADSLHIWDTLLSDPEGPLETLLRVCCAMLILVRRRLLAGDFTSNLKLLQNYPSSNISHLLYVANKLRSQALN